MLAAVLSKSEMVTRNRPGDELATTLSTLTLFHGAVQHADDKARTIVAIQTMLMATVTAQFAFLAASDVARLVHLAVLAIFVPAYVYSSSHLLRTLLPRIAQTSAYNRFAFPSVATDTGTATVSVREQCAHAHEVSRVLANLAIAKHRHVRRAMLGTSVLFVGTLCSLVLSVVS